MALRVPLHYRPLPSLFLGPHLPRRFSPWLHQHSRPVFQPLQAQALLAVRLTCHFPRVLLHRSGPRAQVWPQVRGVAEARTISVRPQCRTSVPSDGRSHRSRGLARAERPRRPLRRPPQPPRSAPRRPYAARQARKALCWARPHLRPRTTRSYRIAVSLEANKAWAWAWAVPPDGAVSARRVR